MQEVGRSAHISLSAWCRDYVYIPLGGNRKGKVRTVINRIIVFFLTGLWHGANWTFIVWGLFHGFFLLLEEAVPQIRKLPKLIGHIYTLLAVTVGFVIFRADTISEAVTFIAKMFSGFDFSAGAMSFTVQALTPYFIVMVIAAIVCCGPLSKLTERITLLENRESLCSSDLRLQTVTFVMAWLLLVWCIIRLTGSSYNPFIYFRF
jgi:alginate O-acetyltransferase complex protein AlgI